jgi:hypothetical protein
MPVIDKSTLEKSPSLRVLSDTIASTDPAHLYPIRGAWFQIIESPGATMVQFDQDAPFLLFQGEVIERPFTSVSISPFNSTDSFPFVARYGNADQKPPRAHNLRRTYALITAQSDVACGTGATTQIWDVPARANMDTLLWSFLGTAGTFIRVGRSANGSDGLAYPVNSGSVLELPAGGLVQVFNNTGATVTATCVGKRAAP